MRARDRRCPGFPGSVISRSKGPLVSAIFSASLPPTARIALVGPPQPRAEDPRSGASIADDQHAERARAGRGRRAGASAHVCGLSAAVRPFIARLGLTSSVAAGRLPTDISFASDLPEFLRRGTTRMASSTQTSGGGRRFIRAGSPAAGSAEGESRACGPASAGRLDRPARHARPSRSGQGIHSRPCKA